MEPVQQIALRGAIEAALKNNSKKPGVEEAGEGFGKVFENMLGDANKMQVQAGKMVDGLLTGDVKDVHEVMIAANKAELSFKFLVEVRNKLATAYTELMTNTR